MALPTSKKTPTPLRPNRGRPKAKPAPERTPRKAGKGRPKPNTGRESLATLCKRVDRKAARRATEGRGCLFAGKAGVECFGPIDPAHVYKRTRRHLRHHPLNILPCCRAHHDHYEPRVQEWREAVLDATDPLRLVSLEIDAKTLKALYGDDLRACYEWWEAQYDGGAVPDGKGESRP